LARLLVRLFGRETSSGGFIPEIDGLRFFAILLVVFYHINMFVAATSPVVARSSPQDSWVARIAGQGYLGVQLFFVISGFILGAPFARRHLSGAPRVSLASYFARRVTRIEPPYIIATTILALHSYLAGTSGSIRSIVPHFLASITYLHHFIFHERPIIYAGWSLEIEVQFYLLAPLLTYIFAVRKTGPRRIALVAAILLCSFAQFALQERYHDTLIGQLHFFLVGFILVDLFLNEWRSAEKYPWAWDLAAVGGWAVLLCGTGGEIVAQVILPWAIFLLAGAAFRGHLWRAIVRNKVLFTIGGMCYTIYLYHSMILLPTARRTIHHTVGGNYSVNVVFQFLVLAAPILLGSALLFVMFEKPFMRRQWFWAVLRVLHISRTPAERGT
jgi:peptidoglycan/LPS O-acetylase OafA/YrhL